MQTPRSFWPVGIAALAWNLLGDMSFAAQYAMDMDELARTAPDMARVYGQMPGWVWAVFAVAVGAGTLGAVLLLLKKAVAVPVYALSLVAIILLFAQNFLATDMLAVEGWDAVLVPALIFVAGVAQLLYARAMKARGVLA
ncbi:sugar transporter [Sphingobium sp. AS12]|uniref:sugar transporter n=1 Tax=Sphingobium sp. AS12 TaxID=2849495 RepID=UPI001C31E427|nr:sugar transporter [Sphingobium sp. AS12]MBV2147869.1 sugar transporter [Sphingobium sp. AS12]